MLKMKITMYELLGLVKDGKAPKKIKYNGDIYFLESDEIFEFFTYKTIDYDKFNTDGKRIGKALFLDNCYMHLYSEVEILDEPKKIPEKLPKWATTREDKEYTKQEEHILVVSQKINEIIDYLKSKGE